MPPITHGLFFAYFLQQPSCHISGLRRDVVAYMQKKHLLWGIGLSCRQKDKLREIAGSRFTVRCRQKGGLPDMETPGELPCLICFSLDALRRHAALPEEDARHLELIPKVLLLEANAPAAAVEEAVELGVSDIIRMPFTQQRMETTLRKAVETASLNHDILGMTREILLTREVLERKDDILNFLITFLRTTAEYDEEPEILRASFTGLNRLFPVLSLHAALVGEMDSGGLQADLFIACQKNKPAYNQWRALLLDGLCQHIPNARVEPATTPISLPLFGKLPPAPNEGHILTLPLGNGKNSLGILMLQTRLERSLSRDQTTALDSAIKHLFLILRNARRLQEMRRQADRDSLTGFYNRRHFQSLLVREIEKHNRYDIPMSLVLLDLDHFKAINDTCGHMAGDEALRVTAGAINETIRKADHCARYGGEEFVLLLPHTDADSAALLAERLRRHIENQRIAHNGDTFSITASFGIASLHSGGKKTGEQLLNEADRAMYQAKNQGRNTVVLHASSLPYAKEMRHATNLAAS